MAVVYRGELQAIKGWYVVNNDVERRLILESYGYRFLRINRFNIGPDPIDTLSGRLYRLANEVLSGLHSRAVDTLLRQANGLASTDMKTCLKCGQIKDHQDFADRSLQFGYGRVCRSCKAADKAKAAATKAAPKPRPAKRRTWRW